MSKRFIYFYFMKNEPDKIQSIVPLHVEYWNKLRLSKYLGGSFADKSGGLITFESENIEEAIKIIMNDPFVSQNLVENNYIKEWLVEQNESRRREPKA